MGSAGYGRSVTKPGGEGSLNSKSLSPNAETKEQPVNTQEIAVQPQRGTHAVHEVDGRGCPWRLGLIIALVFVCWGLRTAGQYNVSQTDAARHAMNGIFLR